MHKPVLCLGGMIIKSFVGFIYKREFTFDTLSLLFLVCTFYIESRKNAKEVHFVPVSKH